MRKIIADRLAVGDLNQITINLGLDLCQSGYRQIKAKRLGLINDVDNGRRPAYKFASKLLSIWVRKLLLIGAFGYVA